MKKIMFLVLLISGTQALAQTDKIDSLLNELIYNDSDLMITSEKPVKFDFIYAGAHFSSNSFYAGREIGTGMYNLTGNIFYYNSTGLFGGVSGSWFDQLTPGYSNTTLTTGLSKAMDKKKLFTFRTSYSRFIYYKSELSGYYPYENNFNIGLSYRKKWIGARIGGNLLFGENSKINAVTAIYSRFTIFKSGKYNKIYSVPEVSAFFSTETISTIIPTSQYSDQTNGSEEEFGLLNTQIYLPLGFSFGSFDMEIGCSLNLPSTQDNSITYPAKMSYSFSIAYMLPLAKK